MYSYFVKGWYIIEIANENENLEASQKQTKQKTFRKNQKLNEFRTTRSSGELRVIYATLYIEYSGCACMVAVGRMPMASLKRQKKSY